jgi:hypothetical protein
MEFKAAVDLAVHDVRNSGEHSFNAVAHCGAMSFVVGAYVTDARGEVYGHWSRIDEREVAARGVEFVKHCVYSMANRTVWARDRRA